MLRGLPAAYLEKAKRDDKGNFAWDKGGVVRCDGIERRYGPGEKLRLGPGESVTLMPGDWHAFWGEGGDVLIGEVSTVNDDLTDNIFREPIGRFAEIEEDEVPFNPFTQGEVFDVMCRVRGVGFWALPMAVHPSLSS